MLRPYCGEYLVSPVPLHLGLNRCSHNCWYCFANLNAPDRAADFKSIRRAINSALSHSNAGIIGQLLSKKYPVCVSNTCDPFSRSNKDIFFMVADLFDHAGIRCTFQTKGGDGAERFLMDYPPTDVYITITTDSDAVSKEMEPGAPPTSERMELARALRQKGHGVIIGFNPYVPEWWGDQEDFLARMAAADLKRIWAGMLHLNYKQINKIPESVKKRYNNLIVRSRKQDDPMLLIEMEAMISAATLYGINVFGWGHSEHGGFWDDYFNLGFPFFPTVDGLRTEIQRGFEEYPVAITFEAFNEWADVLPEFKGSECKLYLGKKGKSLFLKNIPRVAYTFREVNAMYWNLSDFQSVFVGKTLSHLIETAEDGSGELLRSQYGGRDVVVFSPDDDHRAIMVDEVETFIFGSNEKI